MTYLSIARVDLRITEQEFWHLTPAKFFALVSAMNNRTLHEDYRAAIITCTIRKVIGDKKAELFDEFPHHKEKLKKSKNKGSSAEEIRARMQAFAQFKNAQVKKKAEDGTKNSR